MDVKETPCRIDKLVSKKYLDAGIQDVSTSISIVHDLIEMSTGDDDGDESDKHIGISTRS